MTASRSNKQDKGANIFQVLREAQVQLFHDERFEPYARVPTKEGKRIYSVKSRGFDRWLRHFAYKNGHPTLSSERLKNILGVFEGAAVNEGELRVRRQRKW